MRGFLSGMIWGTVFSVGGLAVASLIMPVAPSPDVATVAPQSGAEVPVAPQASGVDTGSKDADLVEAVPVAPSSGDLNSDTLNALSPSDTEPGVEPQVGGATAGLTVPGDAPQGAGVTVDGDAPVVSQTTPKGAPAAPQNDTIVANIPSQPQAPEVSDPGIGFGSDGPETDAAPQVESGIDTAPVQGDQSNLTVQSTRETAPDPATESAAVPITQPAPVPETAPTPEPAPETVVADQGAPVQTPIPSPATEPSAETAPETTPVAQPAAPPQAPTPVPVQRPLPKVATQPLEQEPAPASPSVGSPPERPGVAALPQNGDGDGNLRPTIGKRVVPLTERKTKPPLVAETSEAPTEKTGPPLERFAADFSNPDNKPMMAIVLIDDDAAFGTEALQEFPYPLTFAVDPAAPDAAEKMARHRAAGFEVLALVNLPTQGTAQDAEVALSAGFETLSEAIGILEGTETGIQGNRSMADQVSAFTGDTGRGLITQANGLNTVQKLAVRNGIPAAVVFRDFDGAGQTPTVMRRFLDQAAFRAGQEDGVIMLGRVRPDTISALLLWGLQDRASRVMLAPASAVLRGTVQ